MEEKTKVRGGSSAEKVTKDAECAMRQNGTGLLYCGARRAKLLRRLLWLLDSRQAGRQAGRQVQAGKENKRKKKPPTN